MPTFVRYGGWLILYGYWFIGINVLLLTTTGRKSGKRRTSPVMYIRDGQDHIIAAHGGGYDKHPAWYHNLVANPGVVVELFWRRRECQGEEVVDVAEKKAYLSQFPLGMAEAFQEHTDRSVPVIRLRPKSV